MSVKERLVAFIAELGLSQAEFEKACGISNGYVNNIRNSVGPKNLQKIEGAYPNLNTMWLLHGDGAMFKKDKKPQEKVTAPENAMDVNSTPEKHVSMTDMMEGNLELIRAHRIDMEARKIDSENNSKALDLSKRLAETNNEMFKQIQATEQSLKETQLSDAAMLRGLQELLIEVAAGKKFSSTKEARARLGTLYAGELEADKETGTQTGWGNPGK